jgi:hypothetical protein
MFCLVVSIPWAILTFVGAAGEHFAVQYHSNHRWIELYEEYSFPLQSTLIIITAISTCLVLARNYKRVAGEADQRRVKWVAAAGVLGLILPALFTLGSVIRGHVGYEGRAYPANIMVTNVFSALMPITLGYAAIKHRVLGINVVIRRGIQYLLAKNVLRLFLLLPVFFVAWQIVAYRDRSIVDIIGRTSVYTDAVAVLSVGASLRYRHELIVWVDRKFFREAFDQEAVLLELIERIITAESIGEIGILIGKRVRAALHVARLTIACRMPQDQSMTSVFSSNGYHGDLSVEAYTYLIELMGPERTAVPIPTNTSERNPVTEQVSEPFRGGLVVPVRNSHDQLIGFLLLGEKASEEPYTRRDREMLQAVASQMGIALDLVWLRQRLIVEKTLRERAVELLDPRSLKLVKECANCGSCFDAESENCSNDASPLNSPLLVERTVDGKYRLDRRIGSGGFGAVYEAWDLRLRRRVAVKIMTGIPNRSAGWRFEREARAAARLNHPNIIALYDYGVARPDGAFICMELVHGSSWRAELRRMGAVSPQIAVEWFDQLLMAIAAAHAEGVIHRDLKPENVLISRRDGDEPLIKVLDFGVSKMRFVELDDATNVTFAGTVVGTIGYMSPEQFSGGTVDERSDIFSLGVMLVETLTGRRPFTGPGRSELFASLMNQAIRITAGDREPRELNAVVRRCLAIKPTQRYRSITEMRRELIPALRMCPALEVRLKLNKVLQGETATMDA